MFKPRTDQYLALILLSLVFLLPVRAKISDVAVAPALDLVESMPVAVLKDQDDTKTFIASLSAKSIAVIDIPSAAILLEENSHQQVHPASTTKMMTALVSRDLFPLNQTIVIRKTPLNIGHTIGFSLGEEFLAQDILKALLINSGNDAAEILAQNHPESYEAFIVAMNQKAEEIHLLETSFTNPSGLDATSHYSSAFDLSLIARELMQDELLKNLVGTQRTTITDVTGTHQYLLNNTNYLLGTESGVIGIKTGTTDLAGEALVAQVDRDDRQILIVILGSKDRYLDTKRIIDWVFSHYQWQII